MFIYKANTCYPLRVRWQSLFTVLVKSGIGLFFVDQLGRDPFLKKMKRCSQVKKIQNRWFRKMGKANRWYR